MNQELKFNGYTAQPSDYECQDGDLAAVLNLMPEKGAMRPVTKPKPILNLPSDTSAVYFIHNVSNGKQNVITRAGDDDFYWQDIESSQRTMLWGSGGYTCHQVNAIGNTLCILGEEGMRYFLWQGDSNSYLNLGTHIPELPMSFGLQGEVLGGNNREIVLNEMLDASGYPYTIKESDRQQVTDAALGEVNKFIAENATNVNRFIFPFFVRYAYRLYDGSLVMHSAPIFMPCAINKATPYAECDLFYYETTGKVNKIWIRSRGIVFDLDYNVISSSALLALKGWSDIVKSVDIFISSPIYRYNQGGENVTTIKNYPNDYSNWFCVCNRVRDGKTTWPKRYQKFSIDQLASAQVPYWGSGGIGMMGCIQLPEFTDDEYRKKIKGCSTFYLLKSIPIDDLSTTITKIDVPEEYLKSLVNREVMTDDYDSHTTIVPEHSFVYNSRLNLCNLSKKLFYGFNSSSAFCRTDGYAFASGGQVDTSQDNCDSLEIFVYVKRDGVTKIVKCTEAGSHAFNAPLLYYYYPDANAYQAVFHFTSSSGSHFYYKVPMEPHEFLNGAFFYADGLSVKDAGTVVTSVPSVSSDDTFEIRNKIYTSEVNNPFVFPVTNINTIGSGTILGVATAAKALSQGQFGQFPLYAFTTDGVWALEVSTSTGAFSAKQPITRDVCINPNSITQIDNAVLFATARGIMLITGSQTQCITDVVDNEDEVFRFSNFPFATNIKTLLGITPSSSDVLVEKKFSLFLEECQMLYAYNRQAIILFSPMFSGYAYIYSLESKQWSKIPGGIAGRVPSYPEAYAYLASSHRLVDYSNDEYSLSPSKPVVYPNQFLLTRPIKLDASLKDVQKTIDNVIARGRFDKGHVKVILYGSRDLEHWFPIATSVDHYLRGFRGTPYKYFRIALVCSLTHDESVWGCSIQYTPRLTNQPR